MISNHELEELLTIIEKYNVLEYQAGDFKISLKPKFKAPETELQKDLAQPLKTKEQEEEELLFYSAAR